MELINSFIRSTIFIGLAMIVIYIILNLVRCFKGKVVFGREIIFLMLPIMLFLIVLAFKSEYIDFYFNHLIFIQLYLIITSLLLSISLILFFQIKINAFVWAFQIFSQALGTVGYFHLQNLVIFQNIHIGESRGMALLYMSFWGSVFSFVGFIVIYLAIIYFKKRD